jgi:3,4-dihydroxy 2-butanone 4-phosphate synthase/GTP cyclohydrolase II
MSATGSHVFDSVESAIHEIAAGRLVIVTDDENRENEGDLIMAAAKATPETINMMIRYCSGIVCVPTVEHQLRRLGLGPMVQQNREVQRTDFTVTVDAAEGITTGISAYDRTQTIRLLASPDAKPEQLVQPGHVFPAARAPRRGAGARRPHRGGGGPGDPRRPAPERRALRAGQRRRHRATPAPADRVQAEVRPAHDLDRAAHRVSRQARPPVELVCTRPFASEFGDFTLHVFRSKLDNRHHLAFTLGVLGAEPTLVRVHSENLLGDVFRMRGLDSHHTLTRRSRPWRGRAAAWCSTWSTPTAGRT